MQAIQDMPEMKDGQLGVMRAGGEPRDRELAALRQVLLAPEQAILKKILHRLDDPATRAKETADALPAALALAALHDQALAGTLRPFIRDALAETLKERPDLLVSACRSAVMGLVRHPLVGVARWVGRKFGKKVRGKARIERLYLVRRSDGELIETAERALTEEESVDSDLVADHRSATSMATYLLACLRDPVAVAHYVKLGYLRIERRVFGVHADEGHLLLSVIGDVGEDLPEGLLAECAEMLAAEGGAKLAAL